ncbi:magnesium transporter mrs2-2 [Nicotiana attenuata]|uniref:Magnesium transporter mrs2-2 n=1 Tax=Nicotiana attenuata TaxID=49451 RepID=A0A1J6IRE8_NICAT|nr:magnesium transporter mrs2-2 [Nicotiana attenuata]
MPKSSLDILRPKGQVLVYSFSRKITSMSISVFHELSLLQKRGANLFGEFPFEFRALEVALVGVCSYLDTQTRELETAAYPALDELTSKRCRSKIG